MASTRQCLLNQFADLSVCANQNNFHKNSILVSDLGIYLFTFNLGGQSASSVEHLPSNPASVGRGEERDYIGDIRRRSEPPQRRARKPFPSPPPRPSGRWLPSASLYPPGRGHRVYRNAPRDRVPPPKRESTHRDCVSQGPDPVFKPLCLHHHHLAVVGAERNSRHALKGGEEMDREFSRILFMANSPELLLKPTHGLIEERRGFLRESAALLVQLRAQPAKRAPSARKLLPVPMNGVHKS